MIKISFSLFWNSFSFLYKIRYGLIEAYPCLYSGISMPIFWHIRSIYQQKITRDECNISHLSLFCSHAHSVCTEYIF